MDFGTQKPSRRHLLQGVGVAAAAGLASMAVPPALSAHADARGARPVPPGKIGFGLYSVRSMLAENPEATLAMLAEAGYAEIEPAYDYGNRTPEQFRRIADDNGLRVIGSHHHPGDFRGERAGPTLDRAAALGQKYVGVSYMDGAETVDGYRRMAEEMNRWGEAARARGLRWYAHLHDNEFARAPETGERLFDVWLEHTDPALVWFELDLYWILCAGVDPGPYLDAYEERFPLLHLKDGTPTERIETDLGDGTVDFPGILAHLRHLGSHHFIIERDQQPHPTRTASVSYDYLRGLRISPLR
ncbi:Tat (twin-arginine translocation) pathway signal sequence [Amycolatopsis marina]|uniref:Tat (Twin-arginine translocation) pathway signal sequence n=1 Tax=Amycolatopsis marina TaxID=490629 RepID=A0A1I0Y6X4_9PSEU|nr:sugar phosphate isomerase/epimerase [Amycolatopsis marina]SFB07903.1 Tat (twin-arginine translocation) pathway signal sequence [Amycolatopsis marina]